MGTAPSNSAVAEDMAGHMTSRLRIMLDRKESPCIQECVQSSLTLHATTTVRAKGKSVAAAALVSEVLLTILQCAVMASSSSSEETKSCQSKHEQNGKIRWQVSI